jgi:hypothetical protein
MFRWFEAIRFTDIVLTVAEPLRIAPCVLAGAWLGQPLQCEPQRRKWRAGVPTSAGKASRERRNAARRSAARSAPASEGVEGAAT